MIARAENAWCKDWGRGKGETLPSAPKGPCSTVCLQAGAAFGNGADIGRRSGADDDALRLLTGVNGAGRVAEVRRIGEGGDTDEMVRQVTEFVRALTGQFIGG